MEELLKALEAAVAEGDPVALYALADALEESGNATEAELARLGLRDREPLEQKSNLGTWYVWIMDGEARYAVRADAMKDLLEAWHRSKEEEEGC